MSNSMSRYSVIMKSGKGWWMIGLSWTFCLCMGSLVFTVTNLQQNHECTYVFSIAKVSLEFGLDIFNWESRRRWNFLFT